MTPPDDANPELAAGPGGVPTPTPEPGPTPTPQPSDAPAAPLKPLSELLSPAAKPPAAAAGAEGGGGTEPPADEPAAAPTAPRPAADTATGRISRLTSEKWAERRRAEAAEARARLAEETLAELAKLPGAEGAAKPGDPAAPAPPAKRTYTEADLQREAGRLAEQNLFNRRVDDAVIAGRKTHADYDESIAGLKALTGPVVPGDFVQAVLETGDSQHAGEVLYRLGKDPDELDRILSLPPMRMAIAVARYSEGLKPKTTAPEGDELAGEGSEANPVLRAAAALTAGRRVSAAPEPIKPRVGARTTPNIDLETCSMDDFIKQRNEKERAARANGRA